jgi:hypothetical protein
VLQSRQKKLAPRQWKVRTWHINGLLLERWFLKTLVNLMHVQTQAISWPDATEPRVPTRDVVAACFGISPIRSPRGLHAAAAVGQNVDSHDFVSFAPITDNSTRALAGGAFEFRGVRVVLAWTDRNLEPFIRHLGSSVPAFDGWRESTLLHPFRGMNFNVGVQRAQVIKVTWPPFRSTASGA